MVNSKGCSDVAGSAYGQRFGLDGLAEAIVETLDLPLLILNADLKVEDANVTYCEMFRVAAEETRERLIYQLGNGQLDIPELRRTPFIS